MGSTNNNDCERKLSMGNVADKVGYLSVPYGYKR